MRVIGWLWPSNDDDDDGDGDDDDDDDDGDNVSYVDDDVDDNDHQHLEKRNLGTTNEYETQALSAAGSSLSKTVMLSPFL